MKARRRAAGRDGLAFVAALGFALSLYASIVNLFPVLEPARPALATAALAAAFLVFGRVASGLPLSFDGGRGLTLLAYVAWAALSMRWSVAPTESERIAVELAKLAAIYLTLINVANTPKRLLTFAGVAVLASLAPSLGTIDHWRTETALVEGYRASWLGVYADPNHLAMSLVAIIPAAVLFASTSRSLLGRVVSAFAAAVAVTAIVLSYSRGGALGLMVAGLLFGLTGVKKLRSLLAVALLGLGVAIFAPQTFWQRTETIAAYEVDVSARGRIWAWEVTAAINRDRPLQGVGAGAFLTAWRDYAPWEARATPLVAHNIFLSALGELGLVGFALFVLFVAQVLAGSARAWKHPEVGPVARALGAGLVGYILCGMISGYVISAHFFYLCALAAAAGRVAEQVPSPQPEGERRKEQHSYGRRVGVEGAG